MVEEKKRVTSRKSKPDFMFLDSEFVSGLPFIVQAPLSFSSKTFKIFVFFKIRFQCYCLKFSSAMTGNHVSKSKCVNCMKC